MPLETCTFRTIAIEPEHQDPTTEHNRVIFFRGVTPLGSVSCVQLTLKTTENEDFWETLTQSLEHVVNEAARSLAPPPIAT